MAIPDSLRAKQYAEWAHKDIDSVIYYLKRPASEGDVETLRVLKASLKTTLDLIEHRLSQRESV